MQRVRLLRLHSVCCAGAFTHASFVGAAEHPVEAGGAAPVEPKPLVRAMATPNGAIRLDGRGDEAVWGAAPAADGFVEQSPREGTAPTEVTLVRVAHDDEALYVLVEARDSEPSLMRGLLTRRDQASPSDWISLFLDPQDDGRTGYRFSVNPRGVQQDARLSRAGAVEDVLWDAVWEVAVAQHERGWTAEYRIPFSELRYEAGTTWRIQVSRTLSREVETSVLFPTPQATDRPQDHWGRLEGLEDIPASLPLRLVPYALFGLERDRRSHEFLGTAGGDARIGLGASTTLALTVNPDFGQVEQDPSQLNLSAFEIFQTERRQFFLDGQELFQFQLAQDDAFSERIYYSRRIGERPSIDLGVDGSDVDTYPRETSIVTAGKMLGRTSGGTSYALLSAWTGREHARTSVDGVEHRPIVASPTSFNVARVRTEVNKGQGAVGMMATHVDRQLDDELRDDLAEHATVGGADIDLRFGDIGIRGYVVGSHLQGSAAAIDRVQRSSTNNLQRPDASHLDYDPSRTSLTGYTAELWAGKFSGGPWRTRWGGRVRSPEFNPNDLGFLRRADQQQLTGSVEYRINEPTGAFRNYSVATGGWFEKSYGAEVTSVGATLDLSAEFRNNMYGWFGVIRREETLDVTLLRGGPGFVVPSAWGGWWGFGTDNRKPVDVMLDGNWDLRDEDSYYHSRYAVTATFRPTSSLSFSLAPSYAVTLDDLQFVEEETDGEYVLGRLAQTTTALTARGAWAISRDLTLEVYAMPFWSAGEFRRFYRPVEPRARDYEERLARIDYDGDDRFWAGQLRSNVVLRWQFAPGSTGYLVWSHERGDSRDDVGDVDLVRDAEALFRQQATDVVLAKVSYFLPL